LPLIWETLGTTNHTTKQTAARQTIIEAGWLIAVLPPPEGIIQKIISTSN
jgi:hypothetical protein